MVTVVAILCHLLVGITDPVCHEVIVVKREMSIMECKVHSQMNVANWKASSIYHSDQWTVANIGCMPGSYQMKDAI